MTRTLVQLIDVERGTVVAERVERAAGIWGRTAGLVGRRALAEGEGLWIDPCNGVHTFGMRFAIDVIVLDRDRRVMHLERNLAPNRVLLPKRGGHSVVELAAGAIEAAGVRVGDRLSFRAIP